MKGELPESHSRWRGNPAKLSCCDASNDKIIGHAVMSDMTSSRAPLGPLVPSVAAE
jgi:hypothetical protein